jgi:hypothetical protein
MMARAELITQAEYARRRGCDPTSVRDAVRAGRITLIDGKIDPAVADVQWRSNTRARVGSSSAAAAAPAMPAPPAGSPPIKPEAAEGGDDYWTSRARREKAEAAKAELELSLLQAELVRSADVRAAHARRLAALRESLLQVPARLAQVLASEGDPARCHDTLQRELHAVLHQVAA